MFERRETTPGGNAFGVQTKNGSVDNGTHAEATAVGSKGDRCFIETNVAQRNMLALEKDLLNTACPTTLDALDSVEM